ncbi:hypothetical protein [uncultured Roseibium sp.]|uniref:hypothetical protein n=1 Tax=uncultured Roseibium sp. TaxID=1936171 RepID=UPI002637C5FA|nr:hypothetical protein [uncultured Roseibium sp.]
MTSQQVEQQTRDLIKKIVRDNGVDDKRRLISKLREVSFQAEVAAQEIERMSL